MTMTKIINIVFTSGERLTDAECDEVMKDCCPPEDDEGFIDYAGTCNTQTQLRRVETI